jgi:hypothetical protein
MNIVILKKKSVQAVLNVHDASRLRSSNHTYLREHEHLDTCRAGRERRGSGFIRLMIPCPEVDGLGVPFKVTSLPAASCPRHQL